MATEKSQTLYVSRAFSAGGKVHEVGSVFEYDPKDDRVLVAELKAANKLTADAPAPEFPPADPAADLAGQPRPDPAKAGKKA